MSKTLMLQLICDKNLCDSFLCREKGNPHYADTGRESEANVKESKTEDTLAFTARVIYSG